MTGREMSIYQALPATLLVLSATLTPTLFFPSAPLRRGLHLSTFQLNLSRFGHTSPRPTV